MGAKNWQIFLAHHLLHKCLWTLGFSALSTIATDYNVVQIGPSCCRVRMEKAFGTDEQIFNCLMRLMQA